MTTAKLFITLFPVVVFAMELAGQSPRVWFSGTGYFTGDTSFMGGDTPMGVVVADFNGDGNLDLATATYWTNNVTIFFGRADGSFALATPSSFPTTGENPNWIVDGDFNNDGKVDLATANYEASTVSILLGRGDGTFGTNTDFATGPNPQRIAVGDFNRDGIQDLVAANTGGDNISVLLGQGSGVFAAQRIYPTPHRPSHAVVGDFDGDSNEDVAVAGSPSVVSVLLGSGDGTFGNHSDFPTGLGLEYLAAGDFNEDGALDLVTVNVNDRSASVLLGRGDGTFHPKTDLATAGVPLRAAAEDFDADGRLDFLTASARDGCAGWFCPGPLTLYLGNGDGTFGGPFGVGTGPAASGIAAVDFNGDGRIDLATTDGPGDEVVILLQSAHLTLDPGSLDFPLQRSGSTSSPQGVAVQSTGSFALNVGGAALAGVDHDQFSITADECSGMLLVPGNSCALSVVFSPTTDGDKSASLVVIHDAPGSPDSVIISGTGGSINNPPSFTIAADPPTMLEGFGLQTVVNFVTDISPGPAGEAGQTVTFHLTSNADSALFSAQPAVDAAGTLSYTPAADAFGTATITIVAIDDGGTAGGGNDRSAAQMFAITVTGVNDAPSFVKGANQTVSHPAGAQTIIGWATNISAGPSESGQTLTFLLTNDNNSLFTVAPVVSPTGMLSYAPAPGENGTATVSISLTDNAGTDNGGIDTTPAQAFSITVVDFTLTAACQGSNPPCDNNTTAVISAGQSVSFEVIGTPIPLPPYANPVTFACANLPSGASCTFTPRNTVSLSAGSQTVRLSIETTAPLSQRMGPFPDRTSTSLYAALLTVTPIALAGLRWVGRKRKQRPSSGLPVLFAMVLVVSCLLHACSDVVPPAQPGTPPGTHSLLVTASAGSLQHTVDITVIVR